MVPYENLIRIELIDDPTDIAEWRNAVGFGSEAQVCNRCGKRSVAIAAILIVPAGGRHLLGAVRRMSARDAALGAAVMKGARGQFARRRSRDKAPTKQGDYSPRG